MGNSLEDKIRAMTYRAAEADCTEAEAEALHAQAQALIDAEFSEDKEKNAPKPENTIAALWNTLKVCMVVLILVVVAVRIFMIGPTAFWYTWRYGVPLAHVSIDPRPTDCDFWHAPVGFKDCHYDEVPWVINGPDLHVLQISWVKKTD